MTLRTAVIGGGTVSEVHLSGLSKNPRTELVAICDLDEEIATSKAEKYGIKAYTDLDELLAAEDLDWVHVCTPVQTHLPVAKTVIDAGIPIQIEKPITETYEEFEELAAYAAERDVVVSEKHNHNFDPVVRQARKRMESGECGTIKGVEVIYTGCSKPDDPNRGPWNFELAGGEFEEGSPPAVHDAAGRRLPPVRGGHPGDHGADGRVRVRLHLRRRDGPVRHRRRRAVPNDDAGGTRPVRQPWCTGRRCR
ncbi:Gfo/Idh/MocA family protein [Halobaculum litoreum]|uniref:Gfo/Idh/MocA family protein n=1 Tax=Halobaculum litoreum TaxID=3031998 RepID=A0ABD5XXD8_9EURY